MLVLALFSKFEIFKTFLNNKISNFCLWHYFLLQSFSYKIFCSHAKISEFFACEKKNLQPDFDFARFSRHFSSKMKVCHLQGGKSRVVGGTYLWFRNCGSSGTIARKHTSYCNLTRKPLLSRDNEKHVSSYQVIFLAINTPINVVKCLFA